MIKPPRKIKPLRKRKPFTKAVINSNPEMYTLLINKLLKFRYGISNIIAASDDSHEDDIKDVEELDKLLDWITDGKIKELI